MSPEGKRGLPKGPHILLVRLSALGDVLHATCVARNLRLFLPDAHISWLVSPPADSLLADNPDIDEILVWDRRPFDLAYQSLNLPAALKELKKARKLLAPHHFDLVLDIQGLFLTGLLTRLSGSKRRIGIHERHEGNFIFMSEMAPDTAEQHKIRRYLTALQPLGWQQETFRPGLVLRLPDGSAGKARSFWQAHGLDPDRRILLVNIRTTWPDKHWPPETFAKALALAKLPPDVQLVFPGAPADAPFIATAIRDYRQLAGGSPLPCLSIAGETSIMELAILISSATLLFTCDTGPLYLAEAVGTKTLSLWGPTLPTIYGPLTEGHHFLISPHGCTGCCKTKCKHRTNACMNAIKPALAAAKLRELLE